MPCADTIPTVLYIPPSTSGADRSLSVHRVLKAAIELLEASDWPEEFYESGDGEVIVGNLKILLAHCR